MRCLFTLALSALLLAACAHQPPPPDWLLTARSAGEQHARFYLEGRDRLAQSQLQTARAAVSRTGNASAMARIELHACAARIARNVTSADTAASGQPIPIRATTSQPVASS